MTFFLAAAATKDALPISDIKAEALQARLARYTDSFIEWLATNKLDLLIALAIGILIFLALGFLKKWAVNWSRRAPDLTSIRAILARAAAKTSRFFRIMVATELVSITANTPPFLAKTITFLFTISAVLQVAIWARELILGFIERRVGGEHRQETLANAMTLIRLLVSVTIFAIALIVILDNLGVDVTGLIAGLGIGGIAIGFAAQGIFSDLFAAISIILDKPFRVGDTISYGSSTATVENIGMKSTRLRSIGGELLIVSNSKLLDMEISNTSMTDYRRTKYPIGVIYQTAPAKARAIPDLLKAIVEQEGGEFVRAGFTGFGDSAINFELYFDVHSESFQEVFDVRHRIGLAIVDAFNAQGLEFAYPTQTNFTAAPSGEMVMPYPAGKPSRTKKT
ncbi:MAG: mechanosensitive ion channel domain-containing protein [Sphingorhabdus sp.]